MKKRIAVIAFLFSSFCSPLKVNAEEYLCASDLGAFNRSDEVEVKKYTRRGNSFEKTSQNGKSNFSILKETNKFIILTKTYQYPDVFVTIIDKNTNEFYENYLTISTGSQPAKPLFGKCIIG